MRAYPPIGAAPENGGTVGESGIYTAPPPGARFFRERYIATRPIANLVYGDAAEGGNAPYPGRWWENPSAPDILGMRAGNSEAVGGGDEMGMEESDGEGEWGGVG